MHLSSLRRLGVAATLFVLVPLASGADDKPLVPTNMSPKQDAQGFNWDVGTNGTVGDGTSDCFDNGMVLQINGSNGNFQRPMMTADGTEVVLSGKFNNNITVKRQLRLDVPRAFLRYAETVENTGPQAQQVRLTIQSTLGSNCSGVVTSAGTGYSGSLGKEDVGVLAVQQPGQQRPSVLWLVADRRSKLKPAITVQDNRNFQIVYTLDLPPKTPVTVLHYVAQRRNVAAASAPQLFADLYKKGKLLDPQYPRALRKLTVNFKTGRGAAPEDEAAAKSVLQPVLDLLEHAGVKRDKADLLVFGDAGKITGTVTGDNLWVETAYGTATVPLAGVAAINGGAGGQRPVQVYVRSGEIFTGKVRADNLVLTTEAGWKTEIKPEAINLLVLHADATNDGAELYGADGLLETGSGDRLALTFGQRVVLEAATPWGVLQAPLDQIEQLVSVREPFPSQRITLRNHTQVFGLLRGGEVSLATMRFGTVKVLPSAIHEYRPGTVAKPAAVASEDEDADDDAEDLAPGAKEESLCQLIGENVLAGTLDLPTFHLTTRAGSVPLDTKTLRSLRRSDQAKENEPLFVARLVSGDEITGLLEERTVPVRSGEKVWRVPASHLVSASNPPPPAPDKPADAPATSPSPVPEPTH